MSKKKSVCVCAAIAVCSGLVFWCFEGDQGGEQIAVDSSSVGDGSSCCAKANELEESRGGSQVARGSKEAVAEFVEGWAFEPKLDEAFEWKLSSKVHLRGTVDSYVKNEEGYSFGVTLDGDQGRLVYVNNGFREKAHVFFNGKKEALLLEKDASGWSVLETTVAGLRCARELAVYPIEEGQGMPKKGAGVEAVSSKEVQRSILAAPAPFQSKPGAKAVLYCDFDGEVVNQPFWHSSAINALPSGFSDSQIAQTLKIVAEDFAPFDVNVTNVRSVYNGTPSTKRVMCVVTPTDTAQPGAGGVAGLDTFQDDLVCWNFNLTDAQGAGDTISHEVGHTLNLDHDGDAGEEYYAGHASVNGEWGPIMGAAFTAATVQWSKGEYTGANQLEDDFVKMTAAGVSYRVDDYGNTLASAEQVSVSTAPVSKSGVIERNDDVDVFEVEFDSYGKVGLTAGGGVVPVANLDVKLQVFNESAVEIFSYTSDVSNAALGEMILEPGVYEIRVSSDSSGSPTAGTPTGWTNYGSVGAYELSFVLDPTSSEDAVDQFSGVTQGGNLPWSAQSSVTHDGEDALVSGGVSHNQESSFSITATTQSVSFWYKVSSEHSYDFLDFYIDGVLVSSWTGEAGWAKYSNTSLSNGAHTFTWTYAKDSSVSEGDDRAWIDQIEMDNGGGYASWAVAQGASSSGLGDLDQDGILDQVEYGLLGNPQSGATEVLSRIDPVDQQLVFKRDSERKGLIVKIDVSDDLKVWETVAVSYKAAAFTTLSGVMITETNLSGSEKQVKVSFKTAAKLRRFARVRVATE